MTSPLVKQNIDNHELLVSLIREDLKSRKFFDGLRALGLDDAYYQPDLASVILALVGMDPESDADFDYYYQLVEGYVPRVSTDREQVHKTAVQVLTLLVR